MCCRTLVWLCIKIDTLSFCMQTHNHAWQSQSWTFHAWMNHLTRWRLLGQHFMLEWISLQCGGCWATLVSRARPHPPQAKGEGLVKSMHGSWQKWFRQIRLQYVLMWPIPYASAYAYRDRYFSANALEHCCWLAIWLKRLWWLVLKEWD